MRVPEKQSLNRPIIKLANSLPLILVLYIASLFLASGLLAFFEGRSFPDSLWWSQVTALTIGYGDISPATLGGRITGVLFGHFWIFGVVPLIVANVILRVEDKEKKWTHEEQEHTLTLLEGLYENAGKEPPPRPRGH